MATKKQMARLRDFDAYNKWKVVEDHYDYWYWLDHFEKLGYDLNVYLEEKGLDGISLADWYRKAYYILLALLKEPGICSDCIDDRLNKLEAMGAKIYNDLLIGGRNGNPQQDC